jgi:hypothetical protein
VRKLICPLSTLMLSLLFSSCAVSFENKDARDQKKLEWHKSIFEQPFKKFKEEMYATMRGPREKEWHDLYEKQEILNFLKKYYSYELNQYVAASQRNLFVKEHSNAESPNLQRTFQYMHDNWVPERCVKHIIENLHYTLKGEAVFAMLENQSFEKGTFLWRSQKLHNLNIKWIKAISTYVTWKKSRDDPLVEHTDQQFLEFSRIVYKDLLKLDMFFDQLNVTSHEQKIDRIEVIEGINFDIKELEKTLVKKAL